MKEGITLRLARQGDGVAMAEIMITAIRELGRSHYTQAEVDSWSGYHDGSISPERFESSISECFNLVAEVNSGVVAFGTLGNDGDVDAVYVRPAYARRGIGATVLRELLAEAHRRGIRQVRAKASLSGEAFYVTAGFTVQERCRHRFRSGAEINCVWMVKTLGDGYAEPDSAANGGKPAVADF